MKRKIFKSVIFLVLIFIIGIMTYKVFKFKYGDGMYVVDSLYELEDNTIDVLTLGSSHAFESVDTGFLWDEYGMSSFNLCGSMQPLWNSYYYLKEALKTQKPKLIILEGYRLIETNNYQEDSNIIKNTYGLKLSQDKLEAIKVSSPKERWNEFFLDYARFHSRYIELDKKDFEPYLGQPTLKYYKGFGCNFATTSLVESDVKSIKDKKPLSSKTKLYYKKIIQLAKENNIPIIVVIAPYAITEEDQRYYNTAEEIAKKYDIPFINYNLMYDDLELDFSTDFSDGDHLNYLGNTKFTKALGSYIDSEYDIPDHRGDNKWNSWMMNAEDIRQRRDNFALSKIDNIQEYLTSINKEYYTVVVECKNVKSDSLERIQNVMEENGFSLKNYKKGLVWIKTGTQLEFSSTMNKDYLWHDDVGSSSLEVSNKNGISNIIINTKNYQKVSAGVNILVYNTYIDTIVDAVGFDAENNYSVKR